MTLVRWGFVVGNGSMTAGYAGFQIWYSMTMLIAESITWMTVVSAALFGVLSRRACLTHKQRAYSLLNTRTCNIRIWTYLYQMRQMPKNKSRLQIGALVTLSSVTFCCAVLVIILQV